MDNAGLIGKFKINRPLTENEKTHQLKQKQRLGAEPHYQFSVIKLNSTYLETVDKWYGDKGLITLIGLALLSMFGVFVAPMAIGMVLEGMGIIQSEVQDENVLLYGIVLMAILAPMLWLTLWFLRKESFAYTHYPIRYNRQSLMVHVFRTDGTTFSAPWDQIFFTLAQVDQVHKFWNIFGHVLDEDRVTVLDTFTLSTSEVGSPAGLAMMRSHWEFVRRYVEDGPESINRQVAFCLPISEHRESPTFGAHRLLANNSVNSPVFLPLLLVSMLFDIVTVPFRYFAIMTSKIPRWPSEIESACRIETDDPYAVDGATNGCNDPAKSAQLTRLMQK